MLSYEVMRAAALPQNYETGSYTKYEARFRDS